MLRKVLLIVLTALIIAAVMPMRTTLSLDYRQGEIYTNPSITAPFDIPIYKGIDEQNRERAELIDAFQPVFRLDSVVAESQLQALRNDLLQEGVMPQRLDSIVQIARKIYYDGITTDGERTSYIDKIVRVDSAHNLTSRFGVDLLTPTLVAQRIAQSGLDYELAKRYLAPTLKYDPVLSEKMLDNHLAKLSRTKGIIRRGDMVIAQGEMVDQRAETVLTSLRREYEKRMGHGMGSVLLLTSRFLMMLLIVAMSYMFFTRFSGCHFTQWSHLLFVFQLFVSIALFMGVVMRTNLSPYIVPLPVVALLLMVFFDTRVSIFGHIITVLIASFFVRSSFDFFAVNFIGGIIAIFVVRHYYHRNSLLKAVGALILTEAVVFVLLQWMARGTFNIGYSHLLWFVINGFLTLALYQLVYLFERIFGFVSDITLLELSDTNQPLLLELAEKAPGTFQHSLSVASLAESAAKEVGANPLLARTGALYHDIGKIQQPFYFVENQSRDFNPHSLITPQQSAAIVRKHVTDGLELARRHRLPARLQEFITGHHGSSKIYYFYAEQMKLTGEEPSLDLFSYPGPKPVKREVAICMMADSIEAASRSLTSYTRSDIDSLVDRIIDRQITEHQFSEAVLSFDEVTRIKELFKNKLNNIYHSRVAY